MLTGFTDKTPQNLQLNAGVLLSKYTSGGSISDADIITATRGGGSFAIVPQFHQAAVDGAPTYTKGLERIDEVQITLSVTAIEFDADKALRAIGAGATKIIDTNGFKITSNHTVKDADYQDIWWVGDLADGRLVEICIKNSLNLNGLTLSFTDKGEGTYPLQLQAHYDAATLDTAPYELYFTKGE